MHRNIQLTTGFMAALFMAAVIAPGAPLHGEKQERAVPPTILVDSHGRIEGSIPWHFLDVEQAKINLSLLPS